MLQYFARNLTNQTLYLYIIRTHYQTWEWCRSDICGWKLFFEVSLMLYNPLQLLFYQKYHENYLHVTDTPYPLYTFSKMIYTVFGRLLTSNITYNFLCGQPVFLSFSFLPLWQYLLNRSKYYKHFKKSFSENIRVSTNYVSCKVFNCSGQIF